MDIQTHFRNFPNEEIERDVICQLLDRNASVFSQGVEHFSKIISPHVGKRDLARLLKIFMPLLIASNFFLSEDDEYLSPKDSLDSIESVLYLEILFEEFKRKSGRRGFFIANYKSINPEWFYFVFEFLLCRVSGVPLGELLALSIGLKQTDLKIISPWTMTERLTTYKLLARKKQIGLFQAGSFIGYKDHKKCNDVENLLQEIFEEINLLKSYFLTKEGNYYEVFGNIQGINSLPFKAIPIVKLVVHKAEPIVSPLQKNLAILKLTKLPESKKELKKIYFAFAVNSHPDKFEHIEKGTQTEIAIIGKFREIHSAFEFLNKELEKLNKV